jgi:hypothetical protein
MYTCNFSTLEAKAGGSWVWSQPELHSVSKKTPMDLRCTSVIDCLACSVSWVWSPVLQKTTTNKFVCMYVCIYLGICMCHKDSDGSEKEEATFVWRGERRLVGNGSIWEVVFVFCFCGVLHLCQASCQWLSCILSPPDVSWKKSGSGIW